NQRVLMVLAPGWVSSPPPPPTPLTTRSVPASTASAAMRTRIASAEPRPLRRTPTPEASRTPRIPRPGAPAQPRSLRPRTSPTPRPNRAPDRRYAPAMLLLVDLDGVVYRGAEPVPGVGALLAERVARGDDVVYVTNNSMFYRAAYVDRLAGMGAPVSQERVVT